MKAKTTIGENGLLQGALSDEDLQRVNTLIENMKIKQFDCGHGIHTEKAQGRSDNSFNHRKQNRQLRYYR